MEKKTKTIIWIVIAIAIFIFYMTQDSNNSSSSYSSYKKNGYSTTYNTNSEYRKNVNSVADTFGEDPKHVDNVFHALSGD